MPDAHKNFSYSTIATAPSPATSGTSLVVQSGDGAIFPVVPFNATIWPTGVQPTTANAEIVRVTAISTDTFTITRTQESTSARTVVVGDQIAATITARTITEVEKPLSVTQYAPGSRSTYTLSTSALTALDTTNLTTASFIVPASGNVLVTAHFSFDTNNADSTIVALLNHSGGAQLGKSIVMIQGTSSVNAHVVSAQWYLTGLTPGASLQIDFAGYIGAGSAKVYVIGITGTSTSEFASPFVMTVQAA